MAKSTEALYVWCGKQKLGQPKYTDHPREGQDHNPTFRSEVEVPTISYVGKGQSTTKKGARSNAAENFMQEMVKQEHMKAEDIQGGSDSTDANTNQLVADAVDADEDTSDHGILRPLSIAGFEDNGERYYEFTDKVAKSIALPFINCVNPDVAVTIIQSINDKVLTKADKQHVQKISDTKGQWYAAQILLDCMVKYDDWYPTMLEMLQHDNIKLTNIAKEIRTIYERVYHEFFGPSQPQGASSIENVQRDETVSNAQGALGQDGLDTYDLNTDAAVEDSEDDYGIIIDSRIQKEKETIQLFLNRQMDLSKVLETLQSVSKDKKILDDTKVLERIVNTIKCDTLAVEVWMALMMTYDKWFSTLLEVLRHEDVHLPELADTLQKIYDKQNVDDISSNKLPSIPFSQTSLDFTDGQMRPASPNTSTERLQLQMGTPPKAERSQSTKNFDAELKAAIKLLFLQHVKPDSILSALHRSNEKIIDYDDLIKIIKLSSNDETAATEILLNCLSKHDGWVQALVRVLRKPETNLSFIADEIENKNDQLKRKAEGAVTPQMSWKNVTKGKLKPVDEDKIRKNYVYLVEEIDAKHLTGPLYSSGVISFDDKEEIDDIKGKKKRNEVFLKQILNSGPADSYSHFIDSLREHYKHVADLLEGHEELQRSMQNLSLSIDGGEEEKQATSFATSQIGSQTQRSAGEINENILKIFVHSNGQEYMCAKHGEKYFYFDARQTENRDFTFDETCAGLKSLAGWTNNTSEREIQAKLNQVSDRDGYYLLWYWQRKKRPAVCVTHMNKIKTFVIHKIESDSGITFYIDASGPKTKDLSALILYYLQEGICEQGKKDVIKLTISVSCDKNE